jgi:glycosyltransferase involved in cell wall biosynthesis
VSEYYKELIRDELKVLGPLIIDRFDEIAKVVYLPIDTDSIDSSKRPNKDCADKNRIRIVFNHALRPPKRPDVALSIVEIILTDCDNCTVEFTRSFEKGTHLEKKFNQLSNRFGNRIICHNTMTLNDYYSLLWECDIQFSTASHESFGVATIEAMYTRNACFTPNALSYPEITMGVGTYNNTDELIGMIKKAVSNVEYRKQIVRSQREISLNYRAVEIVGKILKIIEEIEPTR